MKKRELSPLTNPVFKRVFGEEKEILMELINAVFVLEHPVVLEPAYSRYLLSGSSICLSLDRIYKTAI